MGWGRDDVKAQPCGVMASRLPGLAKNGNNSSGESGSQISHRNSRSYISALLDFRNAGYGLPNLIQVLLKAVDRQFLGFRLDFHSERPV